MGNLPAASCMRLQREGGGIVSSSRTINTEPPSTGTLSDPLTNDTSHTRSDETKQTQITVSISQQIVDIEHIFSNHNQTYEPLRTKLSRYQTSLHIDRFFVAVDCEQQTFYSLLQHFHLTALLELHILSVQIIDECGDHLHIANFDERISQVLDGDKCSTHTIQITLFPEWFVKTHSKIYRIDTMINAVRNDSHIQCHRIKSDDATLSHFHAFRVQFNLLLLSRFVDIDQMIDEHANEIAVLERSIMPYLSTNNNRSMKLLTTKLKHMDSELRHVQNKWSTQSEEIDKYLTNVFKEKVRWYEQRYHTWTSQQVLEWIQYRTHDSTTFNASHIATLKVANITGANIGDIDHDMLQILGIKDKILQNIIVTNVHNLIQCAYA